MDTIENIIEIYSHDQYLWGMNKLGFAVFMTFFILLIPMFVLLILSPVALFHSWIISTIFKKPVFPHFYPKINRLTISQLSILETKVSFYKKLTLQDKVYFEHRVATFLKHFKFEGANNFFITNEVEILIAACYTKLNFGFREYISNYFDRIIVYPNAFYSKNTRREHVGEFNPKNECVIFSWHHFVYGYENNTDNLNVGLHEFAHVLKYESVNSLDVTSNRFSRNLNLMKNMIRKTGKMDRLVSENYLRKRAFYDNHEFFAVLVEHYFETPDLMKNKYPLLFKGMTKLLNYDSYLYAIE